MRDAMPYLRGEVSGKIVAITLDDGYRDNVEQALPILKDLGFSATCYVVSGRVGTQNTWDDEAATVHQPLMDWGQVSEWITEGMEIGAHTRTHARLKLCGRPQIDEEIRGSKEDLEAALGVAITQFAYPYGSWDERVAQATAIAGFEAAVTTDRGRAPVGSSLFALPRLNMKGGRAWRNLLSTCVKWP